MSHKNQYHAYHMELGYLQIKVIISNIKITFNITVLWLAMYVYYNINSNVTPNVCYGKLLNMTV